MKTIGLIGGMSWESTLVYYKLINELTKERLGGLHSAKIILYSVDFHEVEALQRAGDWGLAAKMLVQAAVALERAGADFLVLCTNTMHKVAPCIESAVAIPLLHIADASGHDIQQAGHAKVGLLGTQFTMEQAFYRERLQQCHGLEVIVPNAIQRAAIHRIIYEELCLGMVLPRSRETFLSCMHDLSTQGATAIVLGCTEITLLVSQKDIDMALYDTTAIHARVAVEQSLKF